jgi:predicted HicB family RNase H-like nuclease
MTTEFKAKQVFALRLPRSMRMEAVRVAKNERISLNQFVALAVAEKIARLELLHSKPHA